MALVREFKQTIINRVQKDSKFAQALLDESATLFLNGEAELARTILRDLVNATIGFEALALQIEKPSKSLHRMLSNRGNPNMENLALIYNSVREKLGVSIKVNVSH